MFQYFIEAYVIFHNITNKSLYILLLLLLLIMLAVSYLISLGKEQPCHYYYIFLNSLYVVFFCITYFYPIKYT